MHTQLDMKKMVYASAAVFVVIVLWTYLVTRVVTWPLFEPSASMQPVPENIWMLRLWRYLGRAVFSVAFVFIFAKGYEGKPRVGEGLRYGVAIGVLISIPLLLSSLGVTGSEAPGSLIAGCILDIIKMSVIGVIANLMYRPRQSKSAS